MTKKDFLKIHKELDLYPQDYAFRILVSDVNEGIINLNPEFQRKFKRDTERGSRFIESCLLRIPLPVCYFAERKSGDIFDVIDGVQRITTIKKFLENQFNLSGLTFFTEFNGLKFNELPITTQNDIKNYTLRCIILRRHNPKYIIAEIFSRLNQGAVMLHDQEIRHAMNPGNFDTMLNKLSSNPFIQSFGGISDNDRSSEEMILRYFALNDGEARKSYNSVLKGYLDQYMQDNQNISISASQKLIDQFNHAINKCDNRLGKHPFVNPNNKKKKPATVFYDLRMRFFTDQKNAKYWDLSKSDFRKVFQDICNNKDFMKTTSGGTVQKRNINKRKTILIDTIKQYVKN